jgi:hypothetical protein
MQENFAGCSKGEGSLLQDMPQVVPEVDIEGPHTSYHPYFVPLPNPANIKALLF